MIEACVRFGYSQDMIFKVCSSLLFSKNRIHDVYFARFLINSEMSGDVNIMGMIDDMPVLCVQSVGVV